MFDQLLNEHKDPLINALTSKLGVNKDQAGGFLIKVLPMIEQLLGDGKLDMSALLKGDLGAVKKQSRSRYARRLARRRERTSRAGDRRDRGSDLQ